MLRITKNQGLYHHLFKFSSRSFLKNNKDESKARRTGRFTQENDDSNNGFKSESERQDFLRQNAYTNPDLVRDQMSFEQFNVYKGIGRKLRVQGSQMPSQEVEQEHTEEAAEQEAQLEAKAQVKLMERLGLRQSEEVIKEQQYDEMAEEINQFTNYITDEENWDKERVQEFAREYIELIRQIPSEKTVVMRSKLVENLLSEQPKQESSNDIEYVMNEVSEQLFEQAYSPDIENGQEPFNLQELDYPLYDKVLKQLRLDLMQSEEITPQQFKEITQYVQKYIKNVGAKPEEPQQNTHYQLMSAIFDDLKLTENPRFTAFIADIAVNTCDLSRRENLPEYQLKYTEQSLEEILVEELPRAPGLSDQQYQEAASKYKQNREEILRAKHDPFELEMFKKVNAKVESVLSEPKPNRVVLPVLDRFLNLIATLKDPQMVQKSEHLKDLFLTELGMVYGAGTGQHFSLVNDPEFMAKFQLVSLAKNHNFFGGMDSYMKEFCRICLDTGDSQVIRSLEALLNTEITLKAETKEELIGEYENYPREIDPIILAQPGFKVSAVGEKMRDLQKYLDLIKEQDRTREAILLLKRSNQNFGDLTKSFQTITDLIEKLDSDQTNQDLRILDSYGTFEKLKKTSAYIDNAISSSFISRFGFDGLTFQNMEQVYSPLISGMGSMSAVRSHLLKNGMTVQFADLLAAKYIKNLEGQPIVAIMDLFSKNSVLKKLSETEMSEISLNYQTISQYQRALYTNQRRKAMKNTTQYTPVTPVRPQMRMFSSPIPEGGGKFFDFLRSAEKADQEAAQTPGDQLEEEMPDLNIDFDKQGGITSEEIKLEEIPLEPEEISLDQRLIEESIQNYRVEFLKQFSSTSRETQKNLEEYFIKLSNREAEMFIIALINQSYQLNQHIPNVEMIVYKMFFSPLTTESERQGNSDLLAGNLFAQKQMQVHPLIYKNLLETMTLRPKKKHYKKVIEYVRKYEKNVKPQLLDHIINVGIEHQYPVTLGKSIRDFIVQEDYKIHQSSFIKFVMFMEKCKGFEEDAKKFLLLSTQSSHLQISYQMIRPFVIRIMKNKGGPELIKLFEQLRKNITLNRSWDKAEPKLKGQTQKKLRKEFYDGLIGDLMENESFTLAEIVMAEKVKEKFEVTENDELIGLNIYSAQRKFPEYRAKFNLFIEDEFLFTQEIASQLGSTLMKFDTDEFKNNRLMLTEQITKKMRDKLVQYDGPLFHNIVYVYTESQQWGDVATILRSQSTPELCKPQYKTISYLKSNLVYCFQNSVRMDVQDAIDQFEKIFFHFNQKRAALEAQQAIKEVDAKDDKIDQSDLSINLKDKKLMRREARKSMKE